MSSTKYSIIQCNGQRIYTSAPSTFSPPPRGSEVFVGNLPNDIFEDDLIPHFSEIGPIYKLRLMMNFSGETRGFAFIAYYTVEDAKRAIAVFDKTKIRSKTKTTFITVHFSLDNCKLFFGNVPRTKTSEEVKKDLMKFVDGVIRVIMYTETSNSTLNRGFAFVEFESHAMAAIARRKLLAGVVPLWGSHHKFYVDWAEPEPIVDPIVLMQVTILYFKHIPIEWNFRHFKKTLSNILDGIPIMKVYKKNNYAFVHFHNRVDAENAFATLNFVLKKNLLFQGGSIEVEWARPSFYSKKYRSNQFPGTMCLSVPPRIRKEIDRVKSSNRSFKKISSSENFYSEWGTVEEFLAFQFDPELLFSNF